MTDCEHCQELRLQIAVREEEIAALKSTYERPGRKRQLASKVDAARKLRSDGLSYREIADRLGYRSGGAIHKLINS